MRGVLQNQGINLDSANKDVSQIGNRSISVTSNVQQIDDDIIKVKNKIGIFKSLLPNKNRDQELNQIVFGMTKEQFLFKLKKQEDKKKMQQELKERQSLDESADSYKLAMAR